MHTATLSDRVTIVVLTNNRCAELCRSLNHLIALAEQPGIIVVDNGSTDNTAHCISNAFPKTKLIRSERNLGAAGRNLGVDHVHTPYVAFSDDDTWWAPGALSLGADLLDRHPHIAVLNARIVVGREARLDPACAVMANSPLDCVAGVGPLLTGFMAGAIIMRRNAFVQAGGYWDAFHIGGEEALLAMDIMDAGGQIAYAPALQVHHWPSQKRDAKLRRRLLARNAMWTAWLRLPPQLAWRQTHRILKQLPQWNLRGWVIAATLCRAHAIWMRRRVLSEDVCRSLERVWRYESR